MSQLSPRMREHIEAITRNSGLPYGPESLARMASAWLDKRQMFEQQVRALAMREVEALSAEDPCGALVLTYSGSLISIEPAAAGVRRVEYASIPLRADVPAVAVSENARLDGSLRVDGEAAFMDGPVKSTSRLLVIAVCAPEVPPAEQRERIREATIFLTNGFMKINRTVVPPADGTPEQFTQRSIVAYLARKNCLTQKQTMTLLKDYHAVVESGLLLGARVPLGRIGSFFLRRRPARKARVGVNPATGQQLTVGARPETMVARISFAASLKRRVRDLEVR
jgi:nucleoid DNA-binding protein